MRRGRLSPIANEAELVKRLLRVCGGSARAARRELGWLKDHIQGQSSTWTEKEECALEVAVQRRADQHEPLQYVLGSQPFGDLHILTRPPTLIPRWETEEWTNKLVDILRPFAERRERPFKVLDVCTGSGCIALAVAHALDQAHVNAVDISWDAIKLAETNYKRIVADNEHMQGRCKFVLCDIMDNESIKTMLGIDIHDSNGKSCGYDVIVSNPPYITPRDYAQLDKSVVAWEDVRALRTSDEAGIEFHVRLLQLCRSGLLSRQLHGFPKLVMEIGGHHQVESLKPYLTSSTYHVWKDAREIERCIVVE